MPIRKPNPLFIFLLNTLNRRLRLQQWGANGLSWLHPAAPSPMFTVEVDGQLHSALTLECTQLTTQAEHPGVGHTTARFASPSFEVEQHFLIYEEHALVETWIELRCTGRQPCQVTRLDSFSFAIPQGAYRLLSFGSGWGSEFDPRLEKLAGEMQLESSAGRSSRLTHPWFALQRPGGEVFTGTIAWSGNWIFRFQPLEAGGWGVNGGLLDEGFSKILPSGETVRAPHMILTLGSDLNEAAVQLASTGRAYWYPSNILSRKLPVEWNHWWSYEDTHLDAQIFTANLKAAPDLGIELCTLDAGWFGPSQPDTHWVDYRGDWHLVNTRRFPNGIRPLADQAHALGMSFGIWCEIEGLGSQAQLAREHPEHVATRQGEPLGYVCFGSPAVQAWAYQTLAHLIEDFKADWIKLDFNLDPWLGCDRTDHGHGAGDGLFEHYRGYYQVLARLRANFPEVFLENCSSGGLRIDLAMLRQTHATFLSDPDYPVHALQIFWGASLMLPPERLLNWSFSEWCMERPPAMQTFNPHDPSLTPRQFDYYTHIAMLGMYGMSQKLPELPDWVAQRLKGHHRIYRRIVRRFVSQGELYRLTGQPQRSGEGDRLCAFQYSLPEADEHLLFVFRLPGEETNTLVQLRHLEPTRRYIAAGLEGETLLSFSGADLMAGKLTFSHLREEESALLQISPMPSIGR
jgi:alpha-galactosidase